MITVKNKKRFALLNVLEKHPITILVPLFTSIVCAFIFDSVIIMLGLAAPLGLLCLFFLIRSIQDVSETGKWKIKPTTFVRKLKNEYKSQLDELE